LRNFGSAPRRDPASMCRELSVFPAAWVRTYCCGSRLFGSAAVSLQVFGDSLLVIEVALGLRQEALEVPRGDRDALRRMHFLLTNQLGFGSREGIVLRHIPCSENPAIAPTEFHSWNRLESNFSDSRAWQGGDLLVYWAATEERAVGEGCIGSWALYEVLQGQVTLRRARMRTHPCSRLLASVRACTECLIACIGFVQGIDFLC